MNKNDTKITGESSNFLFMLTFFMKKHVLYQA